MEFLVNEKHLAILKQGIEVWNKWREENSSIIPDFSGADLNKADLREANLNRINFDRANLSNANLSYAHLIGANLANADLHNANFLGANLTEANLTNAELYWSYLKGADLSYTNLKKANLTAADLTNTDLSWSKLTDANLYGARINGARIVEADLKRAILTDCRVYGISAWGNTGLEDAEQSNLMITRGDEESMITTDNLEIAQFMYLILHSEKIRSVIDATTSKLVLILGRFTEERKAILNLIRDELRKSHYLPVLLDFSKPASRDLIETVSAIAHMSRFIIADITDAKMVQRELNSIVPYLPSVPIQPILLSSASVYAEFEKLKQHKQVLEIHRYNDTDDLLGALGEKVISPAETKAKELQKRQLFP